MALRLPSDRKSRFSGVDLHIQQLVVSVVFAPQTSGFNTVRRLLVVQSRAGVLLQPSYTQLSILEK